jgi:hypothetical protein
LQGCTAAISLPFLDPQPITPTLLTSCVVTPLEWMNYP